jgi:AcrR family transcriptional regulator
MSTPNSLREQRKAATRAELIRVARRLFTTQGYEQTTLEEVAAEAGLHVQTLYRHFANKVELASAGDMQGLDQFRDAITDRTAPAFEFWRRWVEMATTAVTKNDSGQTYRETLHQQWGRPMIPSQLIRIGESYQDLLTEMLATDFGFSREENQLDTPRLAAIALWGASSHTLRRYASEEGFDLVVEAVAAVEAVEAVFKPLLLAAGKKDPANTT